MPGTRLALAIGCVLGLAVGAATGPLSSAAGGTGDEGWTPPTRLSQRMHATWSPTLASDHASAAMLPNGTAMVAWADGHGRILVATRHPGRSWSSRVVHRASRAMAFGPQLGVDAAGTVTLAWNQHRTVRAMRHPAGGNWSKARAIASWPGGLEPVSYPNLAVGPDGTVLVTFWRGLVGRCPGIGEDCVLRRVAGVAVIRPARSVWSAPFRFAGPIRRTRGFVNPSLWPDHYQLTRPEAAVDGRGVATVVWAYPKYMTTGPVFVRRKAPGRPWNHRAQLSPERAKVGDPVMGVDRWGEVTVAWSRRLRSNRTVIESRTRQTGGAWSSRTIISRGSWPQSLVVDANGTATLLADRHQRLFTWTRPAGGIWGTRTPLGGAGVGDLRTDPSGSFTLATWCRDYRLHVRTRGSDLTWGRAILLDRRATCSFGAAVNAEGGAVASWFRIASWNSYQTQLSAATRR